jgi:nucleotide-binding universal stress UspA family protein
MNNILCPIDFSEASINALEYCVRIAEKHRSSIRLIHVITPEEYVDELGRNPDQSLKNLEEKPEHKLEKLLNEISSELPLDMSSMGVFEGDLIDKLKEVIEAESISLVVMGTEGVSDVQEARFGSNTVKLIEDTEVPILCVPPNASYVPISNIVYGSEFTVEDKEHLQQIINFAFGFNARVTLVHVSASGEERKYGEYVENMKSYFVYDKLSFEQFITEEDIPIAMEHVLNEHKADLLILVHKKRNFLGSLFHKSLTKKMSYMTNFPLLVLRN